MKTALRKITAFAAAICIAASGAAAATQTAFPIFGSIGTSISASAGGNLILNEEVTKLFDVKITNDMSDTDKINAVCDFLCKIGTTPETENIEMFYTVGAEKILSQSEHFRGFLPCC